MTPERLKQLIEQSGHTRREVARLLGYRSEHSLRQCERGEATLPADKAQWLEKYAKYREGQTLARDLWLLVNPPPTQEKSTCDG